ncbi:MAG: M24 family metallopeptidase [Phycisphaerales bacterium JB039]
MAILLRTEMEIAGLRRAGHLCARILAEGAAACAAGAGPAALDRLVRARLRAAGAEPILTEQSAPAGAFPGAISVSVGRVVANGPPVGDEIPPGQLVRLDLAVGLDGWVADCATTVIAGGAGPAVALREGAEAVTRAAIAAMGPGAWWPGVVAAARAAAAARGLHIARWPWGHGVGRRLHEPPTLPGDPAEPGAGFQLRSGMVLAVEPVVMDVPGPLELAPGGWSLLGPEGASAACEERTVVITAAGAEDLTPLGRADSDDPGRRGA